MHIFKNISLSLLVASSAMAMDPAPSPQLPGHLWGKIGSHLQLRESEGLQGLKSLNETNQEIHKETNDLMMEDAKEQNQDMINKKLQTFKMNFFNGVDDDAADPADHAQLTLKPDIDIEKAREELHHLVQACVSYCSYTDFMPSPVQENRLKKYAALLDLDPDEILLPLKNIPRKKPMLFSDIIKKMQYLQHDFFVEDKERLQLKHGVDVLDVNRQLNRLSDIPMSDYTEANNTLKLEMALRMREAMLRYLNIKK
ncbi:MAG: hypothetical protein K2X98_03135 [Alphaproteobacteria bacterium]|nr:hypothetical protein [Alphaproteobacteria bacterium]